MHHAPYMHVAIKIFLGMLYSFKFVHLYTCTRVYSGTSVNNHLRLKASCYITARHPGPKWTVCVQNNLSLNKGHLCMCKGQNIVPQKCPLMRSSTVSAPCSNPYTAWYNYAHKINLWYNLLSLYRLHNYLHADALYIVSSVCRWIVLYT